MAPTKEGLESNGVHSVNGVTGSTEDKATTHFSWLDAHAIFIIVLVGAEEKPFGLQKNFLCAKSTFYRQYFSENNDDSKIEHIVYLRDTPVEVFAYAQNFMYTGQVFPSYDNLPTYDVLIGVWKLGHELGITGLCDKTLEAMSECRRITQHIPATPLLVQVWKDTPEGSSIRMLLLSWAAEYMRSSDSRTEFARSLPQEVLSELVVAMSSLDASPTLQVPAATSLAALAALDASRLGSAQLKSVHYIEADDSDETPAQAAKKQRQSDSGPVTNGRASLPGPKKAGPKPVPSRASLPSMKPTVKRRSTNTYTTNNPPSTDKKMIFCSDLLSRMLSGPGFWTRLVRPFKEPVDPDADGVPDYFDKIKRPMDLNTIKGKMDRNEYTNEQDFVADVRQIIDNCYAYHTQGSPMWNAAEKFQKTFEEKYGEMNKWITKMDGLEADPEDA